MAAYKCVEQSFKNEKGVRYKTYGITYGKNSVDDVSTDKASVEELVELFNKENLDPIHLMNVLEDFLARQSNRDV